MAAEHSTEFAPDPERIELAAQIMHKSYMIGRALETMQRDAFRCETENDPAQLYQIASSELGNRVRELARAAKRLLTDPDCDVVGDACGALHGQG